MKEQRHRRAPGPERVLAQQSGPRARVLDEHMYRFDESLMTGRFRLQLFTSTTGLRPVAVATQVMSEGGMSLVNGCEVFASRVWREHFPHEPLPPLWVQRIILPDDATPQAIEMVNGWLMPTFEDGPDYELTNPEWPEITQPQLDRLVGCPVEADRGSGFVPPPTPPAYRTRYRLVPMQQMPLETPFREACMTGETPEPSPWWRHLLDRLGLSRHRVVTEAGGRDCCWYHGGDWDAVIRAAVRLIAQVEDTGVTDDDHMRTKVLAAARAEGMSRWALMALHSLLADPIMIQEVSPAYPPAFVNGQHRTRAMRDAGLATVLVGVDELVEPDDAELPAGP